MAIFCKHLPVTVQIKLTFLYEGTFKTKFSFENQPFLTLIDLFLLELGCN